MSFTVSEESRITKMESLPLPVPVGGPPRTACLFLQAVGGSLSGLAPLISNERRIRGALV